MHKQPLHDNWTLRAVGDRSGVPSPIRDRAIPARVPGCVHTDLLRLELIDDPYLSDNENRLRWIGETDWEYRCTFDADAKLFDQERIDLCCDGLDTVATIRLNDVEIARTQNMHVGYRFDVRSALRKGSNELVITFASPMKYAREMERRLGKRPNVMTDAGPFNMIRKMACNFGWDWGPVLTTSGIWKGVRLEAWSDLRIKSVRSIIVTCDKVESVLDVHVGLEGSASSRCDVGVTVSAPDEVRVSLPSGGSVAFEDRQGEGVVSLRIQNPRRWWPVGYGEQLRHWIFVEVHDSSTTGAHDLVNQRIGLRTVELDTSPDDIGRKFVVKVNGKPIFCKGFNWIPDDCFLDRACDPARVRKRIQQAVDAGANMLRVWGGGIYETDEFYNICDEMGVLVWQDFLFACAAYPEEEPFPKLIEEEARYNVARLAHHPSLVLWNGCNENLWGYRDWGWKEKLALPPETSMDCHAERSEASGQSDQILRSAQGDTARQLTWGKNYYLNLLPKIVAEVDRSRPYWAGSPWSGDSDVDDGLHPNLATHGNKHIWEVWHGGHQSAYRKFEPRFCSEFGFQGPPTYATMVRAIGAEHMRTDDPIWKFHNKSPGGDEKNDRLLAMDFNIPANADDHFYLLQLNQARALQMGVEWFRSRQPTCMGTLYWQLNDCWPVTSWAAIDGDGRLKPLWYATRRFYAPRLLTIQPRSPSDAALMLFANNDADERWTGVGSVCVFDVARAIKLDERAMQIDVDARSNRGSEIADLKLTDPTTQCLVAEVSGLRTFWFGEADKRLCYPEPKLDAALDRNRLTVTAKSFIRDLCVFVDRLDPDATISDQLVTLLPGDSVTFEIISKMRLTVEKLTTPPVMQCANRFGMRT